MRNRISAVLALLATIAVAPSLRAQKIIVHEGYEAFPLVEYKGGRAGFPKQSYGVLVVTDTTFEYWACCYSGFGDNKQSVWDPKLMFWSVPLKWITEVNASTASKGASVTGRVMFGVLATDNNEEYFGFAFETDKTAEAPVFKMPKTFAGALEAKVKFRMKKLGVATPPI